MLNNSDGKTGTLDGNALPGITVFNVPIGEEGFVKGYLEQKKNKITWGFDIMMTLLYPGTWPHPEIPSRQMVWILTVICFQFMGDYWLRHVRPDYTWECVEGIDAGVNSLLKTCTRIYIDSWTVIAKEKMRLPIKNKGCGLREVVDRRHGQFVGAMLQNMMPLINWTDDDSCVIEGRLDIPAISSILDEWLFDCSLKPYSPRAACLATFLMDYNLPGAIQLPSSRRSQPKSSWQTRCSSSHRTSPTQDPTLEEQWYRW